MEEDQTLEPGVEIQKSAGSKGSRWITYKVLYKDGKEVSREQDHKTTYKGHAPVIRRNTTGVVLPPEETTLSTETTTPTIDGMPDGYIRVMRQSPHLPETAPRRAVPAQ